MSARMVQNQYGKSRVRLTKVTRNAGRHDVTEMSIDIALEGDFADTYLTGDNTKVVATDSMRNTVYVLARESEFADPESFALLLARHFLTTYSQVSSAAVAIEQAVWQRMTSGGHEQPYSFINHSSETRTASAMISRDRQEFSSGIRGLTLLNTTNSEFTGFVRDRYTTLKDATDRIFATAVNATWRHRKASVEPNQVYARIRETLIAQFASHYSLSVQQTMHAMAQAVIDSCPEVERIDINMPNQHRIPVNLAPFGLDNPNMIFVPTDEPFGNISVSVERT